MLHLSRFSGLLQGARRRGGSATLVAVGLLVGTVSVPCVEAFALRANERDARAALGVIHEALGATSAPADLEGLWTQSQDLRHRLGDARLVREDLLLYHGYFLAWREDSSGRRELLAWPRLPGTTGRVAYALCPEGELRRVEPLAR